MSRVKALLHELLGPASDDDDEEEDELAKASEVNKQLQEAIAMAKAMQQSLEQYSQNSSQAVKPAEAAPPKPEEATPAQPAKAAPVETGMPTGDTEESSEEWQKVKKEKKIKKN